MKKIFLTITFCLLLFLSFNIFVSESYALTPTPAGQSPLGGAKITPAVKPSKSPAPTSSLIEKQINSLTSKIASRVAQLKLVEKRGVMGEVTDVSNTQITINDIHGNTKFIDVDEFTKFTSVTSKTSFGISDISKGDKLGILGLYNKESRRILARFVDVINLPQVVHGAISDIDSRNFTLVIATKDNKTRDIDMQPSTKTVSYDASKKALVKGGFSKLEIGQTIIVVGYPGKKDSSLPAGQAGLFEASRVIVLPDVTANPNIKIETPTDTPTPTSRLKPTKSSGQ